VTRTRRIMLGVGLVLVVLVVGITAGGSSDEPGPAATPVATQEQPEAQPGEEPLSTLPTPESVQTSVFERALSECSTYDLASLAGKYDVAVETQEAVAVAVGEGWARQFSAGQDSVADGRDGCLQGFRRG